MATAYFKAMRARIALQKRFARKLNRTPDFGCPN
jgi:hypothetical protein